TGALVEVFVADALHEAAELGRQVLVDAGHLRFHDLVFAFEGGVADPEVEAAALEGVVGFAGWVAGEYHERRPRGTDRAELRDGDLEVAEDFEEEGFELLVGAV